MAHHEELASFASRFSLDQLSAQTMRALERTIIDTVGVAAGAVGHPLSDAAIRANLAASGQPAGGGCTVTGYGQRLSPVGAAMSNGTLGSLFDFDDSHVVSVAHLSTMVIPAVLAACEIANASGKEFLEAVLVGDEVGGRIGRAAVSVEWGGTAVRNRGFFPTGIIGTVASAVGAARALRLDAKQMEQALVIACSYASGLAAVSRGDGVCKPSQTGWAAQAGLSAALLAREGFTGPLAVLETGQGFYEAFAGGKYRPEALHRGEDEPWVVDEMWFKYYPLEFFIHPLVEMANDARVTVGARLDSITVIEASVASKFITLFTPKALKCSPPTPLAALLSAPYSIARALTKQDTGHLFQRDFREDYTLDNQIRRLAEKVEFVQDDECDRLFPLRICGSMRIRDAAGVVWSGKVENVYGGPQRPMSDAHLLEKFMANCQVLGPGKAEHLLAAVSAIRQAPDAGWIKALACAG